jgi:hypothetical protein
VYAYADNNDFHQQRIDLLLLCRWKHI